MLGTSLGTRKGTEAKAVKGTTTMPTINVGPALLHTRVKNEKTGEFVSLVPGQNEVSAQVYADLKSDPQIQIYERAKMLTFVSAAERPAEPVAPPPAPATEPAKPTSIFGS